MSGVRPRTWPRQTVWLGERHASQVPGLGRKGMGNLWIGSRREDRRPRQADPEPEPREARPGDETAGARGRPARAERVRRLRRHRGDQASRGAWRRGRDDDDGAAAGRGGAPDDARDGRRPRDSPQRPGLRRRRHDRDVADALPRGREGGRRPRPLRPQDARLGDLAGAGGDGRVPRLAAADERRPARAREREPARPPGDRRRLRHLRARAPCGRLGDRGDQRGHLAGATRRGGDLDRQAGSRSGRRPTSSTRSRSTTCASARPARPRASSPSRT